MSRLKILLASFAVLGSTLACVTLMGNPRPEFDPSTGNPETEIPIEPTIEILRSCPVITDRIMSIATSGGGQVDEDLLDQEIYLVTYAVSGNNVSDPVYESVPSDLQVEQRDASTHERVWDYFTALIPEERRDLLSEYSIFTDGRGGSLAAVVQTYSDPDLWALEVDFADTTDPYDLTFTLVHEFGHLLTLGPDQVPPSLAIFNNPDDDNIYLEEVSACPQYFPGEGCANPGSYINAFYNQFWVDIHDEWNAINLEEDEDVYYERLDRFYEKYQDQFVTDYAATNPEEDMAESWAYFVLGPQPFDDTIAGQKVLFFYQYPELVELRARILDNLCRNFPE